MYPFFHFGKKYLCYNSAFGVVLRGGVKVQHTITRTATAKIDKFPTIFLKVIYGERNHSFNRYANFLFNCNNVA